METSEFDQTDSEAIWSQIKHQNKRIELKRRWLLGLPASQDEQCKFESGRPGFLNNDEALPESLLREDDMFYETTKSYIAAAFGLCDIEGPNRVFQDDMPLLDVSNLCKTLLSLCVDDLTTKGLYRVATILTGGSVEFEKTCWKMKKLIRESLKKKFGSQISQIDQMKISQLLSQLLKDPQYFRGNVCITPLGSVSRSPCAAVRNVLDGIQDFPSETLFAMHRKLGGRTIVPRLQSHNKWSRSLLIKLVKKKSEKMLSELGPYDELQEPLAKAMSVVGLSMKLIPAFRNCNIRLFHQFSPRIKILHDDITRAICTVGTKSSIPELKKLKVLLDPDSTVSNRSLRIAIKKMLIDYIFECGDMESIPESLLEALAIINGNSQSKPERPILKKVIEEEVECILNVSAQIKQIVLDILPDHELDVDFDDAYMEELEESDDDNDDDDDGNDNNGWVVGDGISGSERSHSNDSHFEAESTGEWIPDVCNPSNSGVFADGLEPTLSTQVDSVASGSIEKGFDRNPIGKQELECNTGMNTVNLMHFEPEVTNSRETTSKNKYLAIQEVCDETSMIAYNLIPHMLEEFAQRQGLDMFYDDGLHVRGDCATQEDNRGVEEKQILSQGKDDGSIIIRVVENIIPSFPESAKGALKKLV